MSFRVTCWAVAGCLWVALPGCGKSDTDKLQGTWNLTRSVYSGHLEEQRSKWIFTGDKLRVVPAPDRPLRVDRDYVERNYHFVLDPSKSPPTIDATDRSPEGEGKVSYGIYKLDGDDLEICFSPTRTKQPPTEFASPLGSKITLLTLKRAK